jgi:transcriptional regulator with XRE-family HTH domain
MVEQVRQAVKDSGLSLSELARRSGVDVSRISRFVEGHRGLTFAAAARVCEALGLVLTKKPGAKKKGK